MTTLQGSVAKQSVGYSPYSHQLPTIEHGGGKVVNQNTIKLPAKGHKVSQIKAPSRPRAVCPKGHMLSQIRVPSRPHAVCPKGPHAVSDKGAITATCRHAPTLSLPSNVVSQIDTSRLSTYLHALRNTFRNLRQDLGRRKQELILSSQRLEARHSEAHKISIDSRQPVD